MSLRVLFGASEALPFVKIGGLADVAAGLPAALAAHGLEVRVALPAYRGWQRHARAQRAVASVTVLGQSFTVWEVPGSGGLAYWLLDCPGLFDRPGNPYQDEHGQSWSDNNWRFGCFAAALARLASHDAPPDFRADILHANDWHTGLAMPWLNELGGPARGVFTIHNLAYQGLFPSRDAGVLQLPARWWHMDGVEFHGQLSHMKAGIAYADAITTVSPTYAQEIQTAEHGHGLDGLLRWRRGHLHGIVNGIDDQDWNPATDPAIERRYSQRTVKAGKAANKAALQLEMGLEAEPQAALVGVVSRLAQQKGIDLIAAAAGALLRQPLQFAILGDGEAALRRELQALAHAHPGRVALHLGYDERRARRIIAGADLFLMPSRFEPCGLTQMYSQRYGTIPVVRRTGGLADTVVDATAQTLADGSASGVQFLHADPGGVQFGLMRALELRSDPARWRALQRAGMARDFSWRRAADDYIGLYRSLQAGRA